MLWARQQPPSGLDIVHIRDWHDPDAPEQREHLQQFGAHCLRGTPGANLVLGLAGPFGSNECHVDAITLNDFQDTNLGTVLASIQAREGKPLRIGVVGVWTEAKITFLLYELRTRLKNVSLATCSALTASASRTQHFNALEQLQKILGVTVEHGVGAFVDWLCPGSTTSALPHAPSRTHGVVVEGADLTGVDSALVDFLYRDSARVSLKSLSGGFSGAMVFRARSWDALGHEQAATVLKLGAQQDVSKERVAFERVEDVLGNDAPSVRGFADLGERAGLKYAYAAMGGGGVQTFKELYASGAPVDAVLNRAFHDILGRFTTVSRYERLPLLNYYTFENRHASGVRNKVRALFGAGHEEEIRLGDQWCVPNPALLYEADLDVLDRALGEFRFVSYVHGDLNGANILLDDRENVWLIDFFHAHRGHVLRDLAKLENDLLYIMTPIPDRATLMEALHITTALRQVKDLRAPLPEEAPGVQSPTLCRAWQTLRILRGIGGKLVKEDRDPMQMSAALLRYSIHTQWFDESDELQRTWALAAAGGHAQDLLQSAARNQRLRVDWIQDSVLPDECLGLTICPGRRDRHRSLDEDLRVLAAANVRVLVCLVTAAELAWAGVSSLRAKAQALGIIVHHVPIADQGVPTLTQAGTLVTSIQESLNQADRVVIHCMGGLGRSGLLAACVLVARGIQPETAIQTIRACRSPRAIESHAQEQFVHQFSGER